MAVVRPQQAPSVPPAPLDTPEASLEQKSPFQNSMGKTYLLVRVVLELWIGSHLVGPVVAVVLVYSKRHFGRPSPL